MKHTLRQEHYRIIPVACKILRHILCGVQEFYLKRLLEKDAFAVFTELHKPAFYHPVCITGIKRLLLITLCIRIIMLCRIQIQHPDMIGILVIGQIRLLLLRIPGEVLIRQNDHRTVDPYLPVRIQVCNHVYSVRKTLYIVPQDLFLRPLLGNQKIKRYLVITGYRQDALRISDDLLHILITLLHLCIERIFQI